MAEPALSPCAAAVRRLDPDLFATALFAPEPGRERLMVLYAFDIELSRAADKVRTSDTGPLIAQMRVQWWRDVVEAAAAGEQPRAHEVAEPLARLVAEGRLDRDDLMAVISARDDEIAGEMDADAFDTWADRRFGALTRLAAGVLEAAPAEAARPAGQALARAFALRVARGMARESRSLLPQLPAPSVGAIARGELDEAGRAAVLEAARKGRAALAEARAIGAPRGAGPAFLPLWRAETTLKAAEARPEAVAEGLPAPSPARRAAVLGWRALRGRW